MQIEENTFSKPTYQRKDKLLNVTFAEGFESYNWWITKKDKDFDRGSQ